MIILFSVIFIDLIGLGIIFPLLPLLKIKFAISDIEVSYLVSSFVVANVIGSIVLGIISDKIGRKLPLSIPMFLLGIAYYFMANAETFTFFLICRALAGFFSGNFAVAFAATSDLSTPETRLKYMGIIGAAFGLGFILGPALGGFLVTGDTAENIDVNLPFTVSSFASIISGLIAIFFFKETLSKEDINNKIHKNVWHQFTAVFHNKSVIIFTALNIICTIIQSAAQVYLGLWLYQYFHFTAQYIGIFWSLYAIIFTVAQLKLTKLLSPRKALMAGFLIYGLAVSALTVVNKLEYVIIISIALAIAIGILTPNLNTRLSLEGEKNQQGLIFGVSQSISALGRMIGPVCMGYLYHINHSLSWISLGLFCFLTCIFIFFAVKIPEPTNISTKQSEI